MGRIRINVGGYFNKVHGLQYIGGTTHILKVDQKDLNFDELVKFIQELTIREIVKIYYRLLTGGSDLERSLVMVYDEESCSLLLEEMRRVGSVDVYVEHNVAREEDNSAHINTSSGKQVAEGMRPSWNSSTAWSEIAEDVAEHVLERPEDLNVGISQSPQNLHATTTYASEIPTIGREPDTEYSVEDNSSSDAYLEDEYRSAYDDEEYMEVQQNNRQLKELKGFEEMKVRRESKGRLIATVEGDYNAEEHVDGEEGEQFSSSMGSFLTTSEEGSEVEHGKVVKSRTPLFDASSSTPHFQLGMIIESRKILKDAIVKHAIATRRDIEIVKNDKQRMRAKCKDPDCPWLLYAGFDQASCNYKIKTLVSDHTCNWTFKNKRVTSKVLAKHLLQTRQETTSMMKQLEIRNTAKRA